MGLLSGTTTSISKIQYCGVQPYEKKRLVTIEERNLKGDKYIINEWQAANVEETTTSNL